MNLPYFGWVEFTRLGAGCQRALVRTMERAATACPVRTLAANQRMETTGSVKEARKSVRNVFRWVSPVGRLWERAAAPVSFAH
jgi:hypothetical protein